MKNFFKIVVLSSFMLLLSACGFMSESVDLKPQVYVQPIISGYGKKIALRVIDARADTSLGGRSTGYGPGAKISLTNDLTTTIRLELIKGLSKNHLDVIPYAENAVTQLEVRILALQYRQRTGFFTSTVVITSALEVLANNNGHTYRNIYRTEDEHSIIVTPTANTDNKNINANLSNSLNKLLNDQRLVKFLAN